MKTQPHKCVVTNVSIVINIAHTLANIAHKPTAFNFFFKNSFYIPVTKVRITHILFHKMSLVHSFFFPSWIYLNHIGTCSFHKHLSSTNLSTEQNQRRLSKEMIN